MAFVSCVSDICADHATAAACIVAIFIAATCGKTLVGGKVKEVRSQSSEDLRLNLMQRFSKKGFRFSRYCVSSSPASRGVETTREARRRIGRVKDFIVESDGRAFGEVKRMLSVGLKRVLYVECFPERWLHRELLSIPGDRNALFWKHETSAVHCDDNRDFLPLSTRDCSRELVCSTWHCAMQHKQMCRRGECSCRECRELLLFLYTIVRNVSRARLDTLVLLVEGSTKKWV